MALDAHAAKQVYKDYAELPPWKSCAEHGWIAPRENGVGHQALMDPAHHKYLSSINFMWLKHMNVSNMNLRGYREIVDYGFF